jgi:hypothetical protein
MIEGSPNPKQWLWATADGSKLNGDRFIIVQGKRDLYYRTRQELRGDEHGPWNQIGPAAAAGVKPAATFHSERRQ